MRGVEGAYTEARSYGFQIFTATQLLNSLSERCISLDERPLLLFRNLKDAGKNPAFVLKHVRDLPAPVATALDKQAKRMQDALNGIPRKGSGHDEAVTFWTGISYAIAVYPYEADYDDEFDVTVWVASHLPGISS